MKQEDLQMLSFIGNSASMNFHVKTPFELLESNATSSVKGEDGRTTYSWNYTLSNLENINVKFKVPNIINIIIGIVATLGVGTFIFIRKRKNKEV